MKSTLECLECFVRQAVRAARIASDDPAVHRRVLDGVCRRIPGMNLDEVPPMLSAVIYDLVAEHSGKPDPYAELKREQNALALSIEDDLRRMVHESADPLDTALHVAAAGNVIDLGTMEVADIDIHATLDEVMERRFAIDHSAALRESLRECGDLLYLLDNAGEIVFDKILIEELTRHTRVTAVVKSGPVLNDALMADAEEVGLPRVCEVIEIGGPFIGAPMPLLPATFIERMDAAGIVLGKGQGNYETLDEHPGNVFLILRAKCEVVARHLGVDLGQVVLVSNRVRAQA